MREIKFRAWHKEMGSKIDWELICSHHDLCDLIKSRHPVEQFTGLKDKNGADIYDGDIVVEEGEYPWFNDGRRNYVGIVEYAFNAWQVAPHSVSHRNGDSCINRGINEDGHEQDECSRWTIIGNIHENPELLIREKGD